MRGTLLFVHSSQVYMEELNDDSSFINHRSTTEAPGTEPKILSIHHASLLLSCLIPSLIVLSTYFADYSLFQGRSGLFVVQSWQAAKAQLSCFVVVEKNIASGNKAQEQSQANGKEKNSAAKEKKVGGKGWRVKEWNKKENGNQSVRRTCVYMMEGKASAR